MLQKPYTDHRGGFQPSTGGNVSSSNLDSSENMHERLLLLIEIETHFLIIEVQL